MGGECSRAVPPAVRNERNPHYRAPNNSALYDDGCVAACFSPPSTPTQARECWPSGWCSSAAGRVAPLASLRVDRPSSENSWAHSTHTHTPTFRAGPEPETAYAVARRALSRQCQRQRGAGALTVLRIHQSSAQLGDSKWGPSAQ